MSIKFIDRIRQDREDSFIEEMIDVIFNKICDHVVDQESLDAYDVDFDADLRSDNAAEQILDAVTAKFKNEDVNAKLFYVDHRILGSIRSISTPIREVRELPQMYWSRRPGKFVDKFTGELKDLNGYKFDGTVREWYETLYETCIDAANMLHKIKGVSPNKVFTGPDILCLLECSVLYRPTVDRYSPFIGKMCDRFKVYKEERLRNQIEVCLDLGDERHVVVVNVLDMNII